MLEIRQRQVPILAIPMIEHFVRTMVEELPEIFPDECARLTRDQLVETIRHGITIAQEYDFETEGQWKRWLIMMFTFGRNFDLDNKLLWVRRIIERTGEPEVTMTRLIETAMGYEAHGTGLGPVPETKEKQYVESNQ